jgi:cytochrome c553
LARSAPNVKPALVLVLIFVLFGCLAGSPAALAADAAAGKEIAAACAGCHGADGVSQAELTPSLAAQPDYFTQYQLIYFRTGSRKSEVMEPIAQALDNEQVRNLGAYYASLPPPKPEPKGAADALAEAGEKLAVGRHCQTCHAEGYRGDTAAARLAGQREDVLLKALRDYKSGKRVGSGVATMADVVSGLGEDDMRAMAHYLATQP